MCIYVLRRMQHFRNNFHLHVRDGIHANPMFFWRRGSAPWAPRDFPLLQEGCKAILGISPQEVTDEALLAAGRSGCVPAEPCPPGHVVNVAKQDSFRQSFHAALSFARLARASSSLLSRSAWIASCRPASLSAGAVYPITLFSLSSL